MKDYFYSVLVSDRSGKEGVRLPSGRAKILGIASASSMKRGWRLSSAWLESATQETAVSLEDAGPVSPTLGRCTKTAMSFEEEKEPHGLRVQGTLTGITRGPAPHLSTAFFHTY